MVKLVTDTIDKNDVERLIKWLQTNPRLTKGEVTKEFEQRFAEWIGAKRAIFVNSGSSANLLMIWALMERGLLRRGDKVLIPAIAWATDLAPIIQLGLKPIILDINKNNLSVDPGYLMNVLDDLRASGLPKLLLLVSPLGLVPDMEPIKTICDENGIILLEDNCESMGSAYNGTKLGNFGLMSSFSTYFGHHISTIEGGLITTNNEEIYKLLLSLRSHGWDRDWIDEEKKLERLKWDVDEFSALYTFYHAGFNLRSTDLQAYIGLGQLDKLDDIVKKRNRNFHLYYQNITPNAWKPAIRNNDFISNFAYPVITGDPFRKKELIKKLKAANIEIRPLICGSMGTQPFYVKRYGKLKQITASEVDSTGLYVPNHHGLSGKDIINITTIINRVLIGV